jgi:hypothetical protein
VRTLLLLFFFWTLAFSSLAQDTEVETYLIIRIKRQNDKTNPYYTIDAEPFNNNALGIYELVPFNKNYFVPKKGVSFYYNRPDTVTQYYNYFKSETEALDFMGNQRWTLVTVLSEISSGYRTAGVDINGPPYTTISSQPVYYFRKKVIPLEALGQ